MERDRLSHFALKKASVLLALAIFIIILLAYQLGSISFSNSPTITPMSDKRPDTNDTLTCGWNASADVTQQNVSWFKDGISFRNDTNLNTSQSTITQESTARGEVWNCSVTITNGTDTVVLYSNTTIKNGAPTIPIFINSSGQDMGNLTTILEDFVNIFNLSSTDPDGDKVTYGSWDLPLPTGANLNSNTGVITWTPDYDNIDVNITFYAKDNQTLFENTNKFIMFIVQYVNDNPFFSPALANQTINETQTFNYAISGIDEESNFPFNFSISVNPALDLTISNTSNTSALIMFTTNRSATYDEAGNYTVTITMNDSAGGSISANFTLRINQTDLAPVLRDITNQSGTQGGNLNFAVYADDADINDTLNFSITQINCSTGGLWTINTTNSSHNATGTVNVSVLTNDHVICNHVRIIVIDDAGAEDSQDVFLNISNTNDPPIVEALSSYFYNTENQTNISDLYAYAESNFVYKVNATDIDSNTYEGEILSYSDNSTFFVIDPTTGLINFTPNQSMIGNHSINISVSDDGGLINWTIMMLEIRSNSAPVLSSIGSLSCAEDSLCYFGISATDADNEDLNFTSNNTAIFNLTNNASQSPIASAYVNFTPNQSDVGNYSLLITVRDTHGASDTETIIFSINNTNDAPELQDFNFPTLVETHTTVITIYADDDDYDLIASYEHVNFTNTNLSGKSLFNISTQLDSDTNRTYGRIVFTPGADDDGNYSLNISVIDYYGATDYLVKNFTVLNKSDPPTIINITPYMMANGTLSTSMIAAANFSPYNHTSINISENQTIIYNITVTDDSTAQGSLNFSWLINGTLNSTAHYLNISYGFFSSRQYNVTVIVSDDMYENSSWSWIVNVTNVNRAPLLINNLENITVNTTETFSNYFKNSPVTHFLDPDDDLDGDNSFDDDETSLLTYLSTNCDVANLTATGHSLRVKPVEVGSCIVAFTATDPDGLTKVSGNVVINVTLVPNETSEVETPTPSTGGGGGGGSRMVITPTRKEELKPQAIELVVPDVVTSYANRSIIIPIIVQNTWNSTLKKITLNASTESKDVSFLFSNDYFETLTVGQKENVSLLVSNYRFGEDFKIKIIANVTDPKTSDTALVLLNTIEQSEIGQEVETKVTFAQDLLNENPECLELNELLGKAKEAVSSGAKQEALKIVDGVIEGCKYLVSLSKKTEQKPDTIIQKIIRKENMKIILPFVILAGLMAIMMISIKKKNKALGEQKKKEEAKKKEEENHPYWQS